MSPLLSADNRLHFIQPGNAGRKYWVEPQVDFELKLRHGVHTISQV